MDKGQESEKSSVTESGSRKRNVDQDINLADFSAKGKGIFGSDGFLAALDSQQSESEPKLSKTRSLPIKIVQESALFLKPIKDSQKLKTSAAVTAPSTPHTAPEEAAFQIDHIIETVLAQLNRTELLKCRLVCQRWAFFGAKELQKIVTLEFLHPRGRGMDEPPPTFFLLEDPMYPLEDLTALMNNSTEFPCTSFRFKFIYPDVINPSAQPFFNAHGSRLKKLELDAPNVRSECGSRLFNPILFQDVKKLLLVQAPNLEHLVLKGRIVFKHCQWVLDNADSDEEDEAEGEPCQLFPHGDDISSRGPKRQLKLKSIAFTHEIPQGIFQEIVEASPNLHAVELNKANKHYVIPRYY